MTIAIANDSADPSRAGQTRAQRAAGRRPEPEQPVPDAEHRRPARARRADRDRARASRRATAPRRTRAPPTTTSVISRTPVAPSARGRGRALRDPAQQGQRADRDQRARAPRRSRPGRPMRSWRASGSASSRRSTRWPTVATARDDQRRRPGTARMPAATAWSRFGSSRSLPQPGGRAPSSAAASTAPAERRQQRDRAV